RTLLGLAAQTGDARAEQLDALLVVLLAALQLGADRGVLHLVERLLVGLDGGDLPAEEGVQLADHVFVGSRHGVRLLAKGARTCAPGVAGGTAPHRATRRTPGRSCSGGTAVS